VAERSPRLVKANTQWTPEQLAWLHSESERLGLRSASAVARMIVQAAMQVSQGGCRECPVHCQHEGVQRS
jgi:aldehyde:ferredoxin oxidoreductase